MNVRLAETDEEIRACHPVMVQLRPHVSEDAFVDAVRRQACDGYRLAYIRDRDAVRAVAGFRISESLAWGRYLYVDDLVTDGSVRSRGYGGRLFDWCVALAGREGCRTFTLDSGVQRFDAHRFYLRKGMRIASHHFQMEVGEE